MTVSVIVCTRGRPDSLRRSLESLGRADQPPGAALELIVVDNAAAGDPAAPEAAAPGLRAHWVRQPRPGKSRALNAGLAQARGEAILFTDDDVEVDRGWVEAMLECLARHEAAVGSLELAPELQRPWMSEVHRNWLAAPPNNDQGAPELIGASMGIRRSVLDRVPGFDPELGPGALGRGEESLFGYQLVEAGFSIGIAARARATHRPDASRLTRRAWLAAAGQLGRQAAYIRYHWRHDEPALIVCRQAWYDLKLILRRRLQPPGPALREGCPEWEMSYAFCREMHRHLRLERRRPRNYARRGLTKLRGDVADFPAFPGIRLNPNPTPATLLTHP